MTRSFFPNDQYAQGVLFLLNMQSSIAEKIAHAQRNARSKKHERANRKQKRKTN